MELKVVLFLRIKSQIELITKQLTQLLRPIFPYAIMLLIAVLAFYQIAASIHPVKHDMVDCFYPWRFYIGECLQNGQLPWWNPYQDLGYPIHADPSSGSWYPVVWLIGYFKGYTLASLGFELWIHVFFAGVGFYTLSKTLKIDSNFALIAGIAYMLSGLFIGNAQHLSYIVSAAWLPFVLNFYLRIVEEKSYLNSLKAAFFLFLMITGGYPAFTIILFYLLLIFFAIYFIRILRNKEKGILVPFLLRHFLFLIYTILLSFVMLVAIAQVSPYLSRLGNFELGQALFSPFSPQSFISFVLPLVSTTHSTYFDSDISMRNAYFGILMLLFFIMGSFSKKPLNIRVLFYFGVFSLLASVGEYLPVREFLFKYIPMMNVFRFPSVFRLFVIITGILTGIFFLQKQFKDKEFNRKPFLFGALGLLLFFCSMIVLARMNGYLTMGEFMKSNLFVATNSSTFWQNVAFQSGIQFILISCFLVIVWKFKNVKNIAYSILILTSIDLLLAAQLNAPYTVYYDQIKVSDASKNVDALPRGFASLKDISIDSAGHLPGIGQPFWQNLNCFQKQVSAEGFNSFSFTSYEFLESEYPQLFSEIKQNKLILLSDSILPESELPKFKKEHLFSANQLFIDSIHYSYLKQRTFGPGDKTDTAYVCDYDASHFNITSKFKHRRLLTLHQKEYKGWKAYVNGHKVKIFKSNLNFMTIMVPAGTNNVSFEYKNPILKIAFYISAASLIFFLILVVVNHYHSWTK